MDVVYNLFFMFGGVAAMILGMKIMGGGLEKFAGGKMKTMLGKVTSNRFAGVGVGIAVTAIIQSSTATTVMLVGFVNIGLLTLSQATNVIMGANIGTTVTAHIISLSGLGSSLNIGAVAAAIGFFGIMLSMFVKKEKVADIGNILAGFGMLFVGLEFISIYAERLMFAPDGSPYPVVESVFRGEHFPLLLIFIGIVITALVHSSSTVTGIMVVLASIGVLSFKNALFLALGSNIGTCVTSLMSSAGTNVNAKRTAFVHLFFNVAGCLIFIAPLWIFGSDIERFFAAVSGDVGQQIAIFHTAFNLLTTAVLMPFSGLIVKAVCKIIPEKKEKGEQFGFKYIDDRMLQTPPIAVGNIKKEILRMGDMARENINRSVDMLLGSGDEYVQTMKSNEEHINFLNKSITAYLIKLMGKDLSANDEEKVGSYYHVVSDIERIGDYAENIMEYSQKLRAEEAGFSDEAKEELSGARDLINDLFEYAFTAFDEREPNLLPKVEEIEESIDDLSVELESRHIERVKKGACSAQLGSVYLQTVSNLERVGDHITNVAESIRKYTKPARRIIAE